MTDQSPDVKRRRLLVATSVVGGVGIAFAAVPFVASLLPSQRTKAIGAPVEQDIGKLEPGQKITVQWRGKPVWIVRRTPETVQALHGLNGELRDPESKEPQQPTYAANEYRSIKAEYLVVVGICTHLGCSPTYSAPGAPNDLGPDWKGGFLCPCHGSKFDLAGRVYQGVPAPLNLEVPPYRYLSDTLLVIGSDEGSAS